MYYTSERNRATAVLETVTGPTAEPVSIAEAKEQCRLLPSDSNHDTKILRHIKEATSRVESLTGARLMQQTVRLRMDDFPTGYYSTVDLRVYPVTAVTAVQYDNSTNVETSLTQDTDYWAFLNGMDPFLRAVTYWPDTYWMKPGAVRITMTVGKSDSNDVHLDLRRAVLMLVKEMFDHPGESEVLPPGSSMESVSDPVASLLFPHRRHKLR